MRIPKYALNESSEMSYCSFSIAQDFSVWMGDEHFYRFVGRSHGINITDYVHEDYIDEFCDTCRSIKPGEVSKHIIAVRDKYDDYHMLDIDICNNGRTLSGEPVIDMHAFNISEVERNHISMTDNINKYRSVMSIYQDYMIDYDVEYDALSIFVYYGTKATPLYIGNAPKLKESVMNIYTNDEQRDMFEFFYQSLITAKRDGGFDVMLPVKESRNEDELRMFHIELKVSYKINKKPVICGVIRYKDISQKQIPYYATKEGKDAATGLLNKRACNEYTDNIIATQSMLKHYMLVIDIDNFKNINDTYGHLFGDEVIAKVAAVLNSDLNGRGIAGRFGGDEFYVFTSRIDSEEDLRGFLTAMRKKILYGFADKVKDLRVTLSIGVSLYPNDGMTIDELFKKADKCLYLAKNRGKNRFIIYDVKKQEDILSEDSCKKFAGNPLEKAEFLGLAMADISSKIVKEGKEQIDSILNDIRNAIGVDGIRIYIEGHDGPEYVSGEYKEVPQINRFINDKSFTSYYNGNHILMLGNIAFFEARNKEFTQATMVDNIMGTISYYFQKKSGQNVFFFYDVFSHGIRWAESDKNYMLLISRLLSSTL